MSSMFGACCDDAFAYDQSAAHDRDVAIEPQQRWLSMAVGAGLAAYGLSRLKRRALATLGLGGYLVYRGATGRCPISQWLADSGLFPASIGGWSGGESAELLDGPSSDLDSFIRHNSSEPHTPAAVDLVDEAAMESFPASDAPSYTGAAATPSQPVR